MQHARLRLAAFALLGGVSLAGCAYGDLGYGLGYGGGYGSYGYGYDPYYGGGYGSYGYDPYYGGGYGYGAYSPFGWYGDYYYPGSGIYVYDRHRSRHVWNSDQQRYWSDRRNHWHDHSGAGTTTGTQVSGQNWGGFDRSRWRNHGSTDTTGGWHHGQSQDRSSVTTSGQRATSSDGDDSGGHRAHDRGNRRPN